MFISLLKNCRGNHERFHVLDWILETIFRPEKN